MPRNSAQSATGDLKQDAVPLRFEINEAATLLRMSRAQLYNRMRSGAIQSHKDGQRRYITANELHRYVEACSKVDPDEHP